VNLIVVGTVREGDGHEGLGQDLACRLWGTVALVAIIDVVTRAVD
jgi:hypothetical protein